MWDSYLPIFSVWKLLSYCFNTFKQVQFLFNLPGQEAVTIRSLTRNLSLIWNTVSTISEGVRRGKGLNQKIFIAKSMDIFWNNIIQSAFLGCLGFKSLIQISKLKVFSSSKSSEIVAQKCECNTGLLVVTQILVCHKDSKNI